MKKMMALTSLILMISCNRGGGGGSSSGSSTPSNTVETPDYGVSEDVGSFTAVLLDNFIVGAGYESASHSGVTDSSGNFTCKAGEEVTFSINNLVVGKSPCLPVITPIEILTEGVHKYDEITYSGESISELSASDNKKLKRILRLIQTIDENGDPSDGIVIDSNLAGIMIASSMTQEDLDELLEDNTDAEFDTELDNLVLGMGGSTKVADDSSAISHFKSTLSSQVSCSVSDISNSSSVVGTTSHCVATSCLSGYSLSDGVCVAKTYCATSDVPNSSAVSGFVEDGCIAVSCEEGYGVSSGVCVAMSSCQVTDIANATVVSGYIDNNSCAATSCESGYKVENGLCVVSSASEVVSDAVDHYNANYATVDFITDNMAENYCTLASSYSTMKTLYADRDVNNFLTSASYYDDRECLDSMLNEIKAVATSLGGSFGLDRDADFLEVTGAADLSSTYFLRNASFTDEEIALLELLFAATE